MTAATARQVTRRFLVLRVLRWLPTGLMVPVTTLLLLDRGFSLAEIGVVSAMQGVVVFVLELPTGGLADALGRRPVLMAATVVDAVAFALLIGARSLAALFVVFGLQGVYRALESGPLDSWYVDAALAADPAADLEAGLSRGGAVIGLSISAGALLSGGIIALDPLPAVDALAAPLVLLVALRAVEVAAQAVLMREIRPRLGMAVLRTSVRAVPSVVRGAVSLVRASKVLLALAAVELLWGFGMTTFERLIAPRLADVTGSSTAGAALLGPATSAAWLVSAVGAAAVPWASRRWGPAMTAGGLRVVQGCTVAGMALAAGTAGVIVAYLATYGVHGAANPVHAGLLHADAREEHRATVLSVNSMASLTGGAVGGIALGWLADVTSVPTAMLAGAVVLAAAAPLYLPARHRDRLRGATVAP